MRVRTPILQCLRTLQEVECVPRHDKNHITASRRRAVHDHIRSVITYQSTSSATRCSAANEPNDSRAQGRETGRARTDMPWPCCPHVSSAAERAELPRASSALAQIPARSPPSRLAPGITHEHASSTSFALPCGERTAIYPEPNVTPGHIRGAAAAAAA